MAEEKETPSLTVEDVMRRYTVARPTVYSWVRRKVLRAVKLGGAVRFYASDLERFERRGATMAARPHL
jgi:excisionase family DNA binding protein